MQIIKNNIGYNTIRILPIRCDNLYKKNWWVIVLSQKTSFVCESHFSWKLKTPVATFGSPYAFSALRSVFKVHLKLVICGLFICSFLCICDWKLSFFKGTYTIKYSVIFVLFMWVFILCKSNFFGRLLSHLTRSACIVEPVYNGYPRDPKVVAVVDRWSLFRSHLFNKGTYNTGTVWQIFG